MTRDEAIKELQWVRKTNEKIIDIDSKELDINSAWIKHWKCIVEALDIAIKALEQEPILDLIREEIENTYYEMPSNYNHMQRTNFFLQVIKIIDRYKAESEG